MYLENEFHNKIENPKMLSPLNLAFIGDGIYELLVREHILRQANVPVNVLHKKAVELVRASAQSKAVDLIYDMLTEEEIAIFKRGRNTSSSVPKNADVAEYRRATGLEALFGYLYCSNQNDRLCELFEKIASEI